MANEAITPLPPPQHLVQSFPRLRATNIESLLSGCAISAIGKKSVNAGSIYQGNAESSLNRSHTAWKNEAETVRKRDDHDIQLLDAITKNSCKELLRFRGREYWIDITA